MPFIRWQFGRRAPSGSRLERIVDNQFWVLGSGLGGQKPRALGMELPTRQLVSITASEMQAEMETPSWQRRNRREVMGKASGHFHPAGQTLGQIAEFDLEPLFLFSSVNFLRKQDDKNHSALLRDTNRPYSEIFTLYVIATQHHKACGSVRNIRVPLRQLRLRLPSEWMLD